ncbi:MAG: hypothetical protein ACTSPS_13720 [Promethearchaeota archaeon]
MPEVLELEPLKKKQLKLIMIESEFPIEWWFEVPVKIKENLIWDLQIISKEYLELISGLMDKYHPDFTLEEKGMRDDKLNPNDPLIKLFKEQGIPFKFGDISQNANDYLSAALDDHREGIKKLETRIKEIIEENGYVPKEDELFQQIVLWKEYLHLDYSDQEMEIRYKVREAWMMMNVLNFAREIDKKTLTGFIICDLRHFNGLEKLANELGVEIEQIKIQRRLKEIESIKDVAIEI